MKSNQDVTAGKEGLVGDVYGVTFNHTYKVSGFMADATKRHDCLNSGYWCFKNLLEHPGDIRGYIKKRLKRLSDD